MNGLSQDAIFGLAAAGWLAIALVELVLMVTWNRWLIGFGIPIFSTRRDAYAPRAPLPRPERLEREFDQGLYVPLLFRQIGDDLYAFRESYRPTFARFSYSPIMRGTIRFDRERGRVVVTGRSYWWVLAFVAAFGFSTTYGLVEASFEYGLIDLLFLAGLIGWIYRIQAGRFRRVATAAATQWSGRVVQAS